MPTKIEWATEVWNPVTGCTKISPGCKNCYAERMSKRLNGRFGYPADEPFRVTLHPDRLTWPSEWNKPRRIFVCSMGDLFHPDVPKDFINKVFAAMTHPMFGGAHHTYLILTKRPEKIPADKWYPGWKHIGLGVSVENQKAADERRLSFKNIPAAVKFVSYEPALGAVDWSGWEFVDQIIFGGESGPGRRPVNLDWAYSTLEFCREHDIAFFMKQVDKIQPIPKDLMIREFPK